jgi:hypothetical protein
MKRPFDSIRELVFENLEQFKENSRFVFEQADKLIVWIVGFAIGGLSLIVSNYTELDKNFSYNLIRIILTLLTISIISGILFRIAFFFSAIYERHIESYIHAAYSNKEFMEIAPNDLSEETNINEVIRRIRVDFGEDTTNVLEHYDKADNNEKLILLESLKAHYKKIGEWAKKDFEFAVEYSKDTLKKAYGYSDKKINEIFNDNSSSKLKFWNFMYQWSFLISCLCFITVIIILCIFY